MKDTYKTFKRSVTCWADFARARKYTDRRGLTYEEALARCDWWNDNRTPAQIRRGTKMEFTKEN